MAGCDSQLWLNGVIITSVGISFLFSAFVLKGTMKEMKEELEYASDVDMKKKLINSTLPVVTKKSKVLDF